MNWNNIWCMFYNLNEDIPTIYGIESSKYVRYMVVSRY